MANSVKPWLKEDLRQRYLSGESIKSIVKTLGISRNAIRRLIKSEGLVPTTVKKPQPMTSAVPVAELEKLDLKLLEKIYARSNEPGRDKDFENQIKSIATDIAAELGVRGRVSSMRLELALTQYVLYRRFFVQSMETSDKQYAGPYSKFHDRQAKATVAWVDASHKALTQLNGLLRELEVTGGRRGPSSNESRTVVQQVNVNVGSS